MTPEADRLTAAAAADAIERGELTAEALVVACLARIDAREPVVRAWTAVARDSAIAEARRLDRGPRRGPLHGIPVAIKDLIATADLPTCYGSPLYDGHRPPFDAACVALLRDAGAIILGKSVTTEFAYFHPGPTSNPHDSTRTPGGSSSGSAAAVADGMVPLALGTQTAGSVTRPASYCGIVGFKPSWGWTSLAGIKPFAPSLDTLGLFARDIDDTERLRAVLSRDVYRPLERVHRRLRIGVCRTEHWDRAEPCAREAVTRAVTALAATADMADVDLPRPGSRTLADLQKLIMAREAADALAPEYRERRADLSEPLRTLIDTGRAIAGPEHVAILAAIEEGRRTFATAAAAFDVILTPSAPGEAPPGLDATGDPMFSRPWTLLGVPSVTLPLHRGPAGMPVGLQFVGHLHRDRALLEIASTLAGRLA